MTKVQRQQLVITVECLEMLNHSLWEAQNEHDRHLRDTLSQALVLLHGMISETSHDTTPDP